MSVTGSVRITSWNVNGIKSLVTNYGSLEHIHKLLDADIVCFQETKLMSRNDSTLFISEKYWSFFSLCRPARAYSGTATFVRKNIPLLSAQEGLTGLLAKVEDRVLSLTQGEFDDIGLSAEEALAIDQEGRCVITDHGGFVVINVYAPNASPDSDADPDCDPDLPNTGPASRPSSKKPDAAQCQEQVQSVSRFEFKLRFQRLLSVVIAALRRKGRSVVVVGDLNAVHSPVDSCFWEEPPRSSLTCPQPPWSTPATWLRTLLSGEDSRHLGTAAFASEQGAGECEQELGLSAAESASCVRVGMTDSFRHVHPKRESAFTCWSTYTGARKTNYGCRLDYVLVSVDLRPLLLRADIQPEIMGSDHCPVFAELQLSQASKQLLAPLSQRNANPPPLCSCYYPGLGFSRKQASLKTFLIASNDNSSTLIDESGLGSDAVACRAEESLHRELTVNESAKRALESYGPEEGSRADSELSINCHLVSVESKKQKVAVTAKQRTLTDMFGSKSSNKNSAAESKSQPAPAQSNVTAMDYPTPVGGLIESVTVVGVDDVSSTVERSTQSCLHAQVVSGSASSEHRRDAFALLRQRPPPPPLCSGHAEQCVQRTVVKEGANKGRRFYTCRRPPGMPGDSQASCGYFLWEHAP